MGCVCYQFHQFEVHRAVKDRKAALAPMKVMLTGHGKAVPVYTDTALVDFKVITPAALLAVQPAMQPWFDKMLCCATMGCAEGHCWLCSSAGQCATLFCAVVYTVTQRDPRVIL